MRRSALCGNRHALVVALASCVFGATAQVTLPDLFGSHAIVQRAKDTAVWGKADPGETVTVTLAGVSSTAKAGNDGWWLARLDTSKLADGPFDLTAKGASGEVKSQDILVGEVWLAGGQSNMEFSMKSFGGVVGYEKRAAACKGRPIRVFKMTHRSQGAPIKGDAKGVWRVISPETLGSVTAVGYMFIDTLQKQIGGAAGVVDISWSGTRCWAWMPIETIDAHEELKAERLRQEALIAKGEGKQVRKPVLRCWNNMFFPVSKMTCRGIIWYQGCCDSGHRDSLHLYPKWLSYMVADMRREMGKPNLPFLYCQLAGWQHMPKSPDANPGPANLREAQRRAQKLIPDSAMAVILDSSEHEIHGRFKEPAGDRLAALALNRVYGKKDVVCKSPDFAEAKFGPASADVRFDIEGSPLAAQPLRTSFTWNVHSNDVIRIERRSSPASQLEGFTIQDAAGKWHWADARITGRDTVKVWADGVSNPKAVRYNWGMQGPGNLYNAAGLPASCFTTEP